MASRFTGGSGGSGGSNLPEYLTDPVSPTNGDAWVLRTQRTGNPIGMLLSLTYATDFYQLSYRTTEGLTVRTILA